MIGRPIGKGRRALQRSQANGSAPREDDPEAPQAGDGRRGHLKKIRSMEEENGNRYENGPDICLQVIADHRKQSEVAAA